MDSMDFYASFLLYQVDDGGCQWWMSMDVQCEAICQFAPEHSRWYTLPFAALRTPPNSATRLQGCQCQRRDLFVDAVCEQPPGRFISKNI